MQQAIQYRTWLPPAATSSAASAAAAAAVVPEDRVQKLVSENALIVFANRGCCMCHVAKQLLLGLGVNPAVEEVDETEAATVIDELSQIPGFCRENEGEKVQLPAFFVGGKYFGNLERVMAMHISGELLPVLREAGALWL